MKRHLYISTILLTIFALPLFSQSNIHLLSNWDYKRKEGQYEKINKVIATTNGYLVAVGETLGKSSKDLDGLFMVLNSEDGREKTWKLFGGPGNQVFHSVVQNHDGTFTLVGYNQSEQNADINAWIVQLDLEGNKLSEESPGNSDWDEVLRDIDINAAGDLLAIGMRSNKRSGEVWLQQIGKHALGKGFGLKTVSEGEVKSIAAAPDGSFVLVGNTSSKNREHPEDIWVSNIDTEGQDLWGGIRYFGDRDFQEGWDITPTIEDGGYAVIGTTNSKSNGMTDIWLIKLDKEGKQQWDKNFGGHAADVGTAIVELSTGGFALLGQTWSHMPRARNSTMQLIITDSKGIKKEDDTYPIFGGEGDEVPYSLVELLSNDNIVIAGNTQPENSSAFPTTYIGAITYRTLESGTGNPAGEDRFGSELRQAIKVSPAFLVDPNSNNFLEPNERGYLQLEVTNDQATDLYNVTASVVGSGPSTALDYWKTVKIGALKAGQKKKVFVPVYAKGNLPSDHYELNINLEVNGRYAASATTSIESNQPDPARLEVVAHSFSPGSQPKPGQSIQLSVDLVNSGSMPSEPLDVYFGLPEGVRPMEPQTMRLPALNPNQPYQLTFSFVYDESFRGNILDVLFQTRSSRIKPIFERYALQIAELSSPIAQNDNTGNNTRNIGDMMVWMSHDPDEQGSRTFATNERDVDIKLKILTTRELDRNRLNVYINGSKHQGQKMDEVKLTSEGSNIGRYNYQNKLRLREGPNEVRIVYEDETGVEFSSPELVFDYSPKDKPNLYVFSIGVKHQDLKYTVKDARDFAGMYARFRDVKDNRVFRKVEVFEVTEEEMTTANNIKAAFIRMSRMNIKDGDLVVIFISSHGKISNQGDFILIPSDYNPELEELYSVNFNEDILKKLRTVDGNKLVFIDACHSGSALSSGSRSFSSQASSKVMNDLIRASSGLEVIASCGDNEYSYEDDSWGNGAFTKAIMEAFQGNIVEVDGGKRIKADIYNEVEGVKKDGGDQVITIEELKYFIQQRVPYLVKSTKVNPPTEQRPSNKSTELLPEDMGIFMLGGNE